MPKLLAFFFIVILILVVVYLAKVTYDGAGSTSGAAETSSAIPDINRLADFPEKIEYRHDIKSYDLPTIHDGQRKLLLSEIELLTKYGDLAPTVVYIGAAMGRHLLTLHELFPKHKFILYDPNPFHEPLLTHKAFEIHNDFFTDEDVKKYKKKPILFISDIRSQDNVDDPKKFEESIVEDMARQRKWVEEIKPKASSLKFRLPFTPGVTEYLDGDVYIQSYPPKFSAECRLFVTDKQLKKTKKYNHTEHEQRMWYHNNIARTCGYEHNIEYPGLDYCYDCASQLQIINEYLEKNPKSKLTRKLILDKINDVTKPLTRNNHGKKISADDCKQNQARRKLLIQTTPPKTASLETNIKKARRLFYK